jgi:hypothetical protein
MNNQMKILLVLGVIAGAYYLFKEDEDNVLIGGLGDELDEEDVDAEELEMGIKVEMEHTKDKNIAREIALDHLSETSDYYTKLKAIHKENPVTSKRANEKLWDKVKKEAVQKMGGHSARAMQYAVKLYKDRGGKYLGKKRSDNDLATWTRAKWQYAPGSKTKDRYLPLEAWRKLNASQEKATRAKKKGKLGEWIPNTKKAKEAAKKATNKARGKK